MLENSQRVDVLVARGMPTILGDRLAFDDLWAARQMAELAPGAWVALPSIEHLILTKQFAPRAKDAEDVKLLRVLLAKTTP